VAESPEYHTNPCVQIVTDDPVSKFEPAAPISLGRQRLQEPLTGASAILAVAVVRPDQAERCAHQASIFCVSNETATPISEPNATEPIRSSGDDKLVDWSMARTIATQT